MLQQKSLVGRREADEIGFKCDKRIHGLCRKNIPGISTAVPKQFGKETFTHYKTAKNGVAF